MFPEKLAWPPLQICAVQRGSPVFASNAAIPPTTPTNTRPASTAGKPGHAFGLGNGVNQRRLSGMPEECPSTMLPQLKAVTSETKVLCEHQRIRRRLWPWTLKSRSLLHTADVRRGPGAAVPVLNREPPRLTTSSHVTVTGWRQRHYLGDGPGVKPTWLTPKRASKMFSTRCPTRLSDVSPQCGGPSSTT